MSNQRARSLITLCLLLMLVFLPSCSTAPQNTNPEPAGDTAEEGGALDQGSSSDGGESDSGAEGGEPGLIALTCPQELTYFKLQLKHSFSFSPGGNKELMQVTGNTTGDAWCLIAVQGNRVEAEPCIVGYQYSGWLETDAGKCDISGSSTAFVEVEGDCAVVDPDASGDEGVAEVTLAITEGQDPDADLSGAMNCPGVSQPYMGFYPPTFSVMTFLIDDGGSTDTDVDDSDISGQFSYQKSWTMTPSR
jgi:hypothetical protein